MVLVDSTVILDVARQDPHWRRWSRQQWKDALTAGPVVINVILYGEIAFACERIEVVDEILPAHLYHYRSIPREAAFLAACAHGDDRERGGQRRRIPLLTRVARRYRQAFPGPELITLQR
ncbi:DNA-binding protein [Cyanobium sp. AMD-g]|uniref:DNA-binding protein n=1 Tax=Cyanobium sp. AMD-g TaxID=2823699 RepID=UPI0020CC9119|nr:DNA-binding protein [Cyanobium sp. AMD-g]MCP9931173.1 DNA-binding protein [Cyanobium sp. AMD-g]